ncbi:MAG: EF-P lysine aminoacylase EpmA, partial [Thiohalospira sp.]
MAEDWRPTASREALVAAAAVRRRLRDFLEARGYLEVETPVLSVAGNPDPAVEPLKSHWSGPGGDHPVCLATSPEFPMKRLLAAGSGPIYQFARAFRQEERGRRHNPEFTLLEWYRPGVAPMAFVDELVELVRAGTGEPIPARTLTVREAFAAVGGPDPHTATLDDWRAAAADRAAAGHGRGEVPTGLGTAPAVWRDWLLTHHVEPWLAEQGLVVLTDYPVDQAALARIRPGDPAVAERFEVYLHGMELANGFHELDDAVEQRARFEADNARRRKRGLEPVALDERLLAALESGLGECCGVALGVDRLVMGVVGAE